MEKKKIHDSAKKKNLISKKNQWTKKEAIYGNKR